MGKPTSTNTNEAEGPRNKSRIIVIQPDEHVTLDRYGEWFTEFGAEYRTVELFNEEVPSLEDCGDGIVVLGGRMNAVDKTASPWLEPLHDLLSEARDANFPVLGICLGIQIFADCFGGEVTVGAPGMGEEGAFEAVLNDAGQADPILGVLGARKLVAESHNDVVTRLPEGAVLLASSERCPVQALRLGSLVGVQFHPEVSPEQMDYWAVGDGAQPGILLEKMRVVDEEIVDGGRKIARAFVGTLER